MRITPIDFSQNALLAALRNPTKRILDHARIAGSMELTVPALAEATKLDIETVQSAMLQLARLGIAQPTRKIGNAQAYKFIVQNGLHSRLSRTG